VQKISLGDIQNPENAVPQASSIESSKNPNARMEMLLEASH